MGRNWSLVRIDSALLGELREVSKRRAAPVSRLVEDAVRHRFLTSQATAIPSGNRAAARVSDDAPAAKLGRMVRLEFTVGEEAAARYRAFAVGQRMPLSRAIAELGRLGLEVHEHRHGVPPSRVDELLDELRKISDRQEALGPSVLGMIRVLAAWAARSGGLGVSEEDLLNEMDHTGRDEWESAIEARSKGRAVVSEGD